MDSHRLDSRVRSIALLAFGWAAGLPSATAAELVDAASAREVPRVDPLSPRIVNGVSAPGDFPTVGLLARKSFATGVLEGACSGTLIGCNTFLTAAHCFNGLAPNPAQHVVFLQHAGFFGVSSIALHPSWNGNLTQPGDLAVLKLTPQVTGVRPTQINALGLVPFDSTAGIVGFGGTGGPLNPGMGIKRFGQVMTAECTPPISDSSFICWNFLDSIGPAGQDSTVCKGDSGVHSS